MNNKDEPLYVVATNGDDDNPGTAASPWLTIAKGLSMLPEGETLYIRAGTYTKRHGDDR